MLLREKGKKNAEPTAMDWDQAQAALQTGKYEIADEVAESEHSERGPDQPAAQSPSPGTKPAAEAGKSA
jgi:hypothetical protein